MYNPFDELLVQNKSLRSELAEQLTQFRKQITRFQKENANARQWLSAQNADSNQLPIAEPKENPIKFIS
jgi:hypothetical protein